ncbi:MAG: adenylate kinase [Conexivisphaera sp.]|jgi:adenylate kinase|nr:adenylate kinase [Conexivisphaerales archaeon]
MRAVIGGIPGVGKSTVLDILRAKLGARLEVVNYGTVMMEEAKLRGAADRDQMRRLPAQVQREIQASAARKISSMRVEFLLVDTHFSIKTPQGYLPGMPSHVVSALAPDALIVLFASAEEISSRRAADATRVRESSIESVREELEMERLFAVAASNESGAPLAMIMNRQGEAEGAAKSLAAVMGV